MCRSSRPQNWRENIVICQPLLLLSLRQLASLHLFLFFSLVSWLLLNTAANDLLILIALLVIDADDLSENNTFY